MRYHRLFPLIIFVTPFLVEYTSAQQEVQEEPASTVEEKQENRTPRKDETGEPIEELSLDEVRSLILQLGHHSFSIRDQAQKKLFDQGPIILDKFEILASASGVSLDGGDPEINWRIEAIRRGVTRSPFEGSSWRLTYTEKRDDLSVKEKTIVFNADHSFGYQTATQSHKLANNSEWSSESPEQITFSFNNRYAVYEGKRVSENVIEGVANNIKGKTWKWRLTFVK